MHDISRQYVVLPKCCQFYGEISQCCLGGVLILKKNVVVYWWCVDFLIKNVMVYWWWVELKIKMLYCIRIGSSGTLKKAVVYFTIFHIYHM